MVRAHDFRHQKRHGNREHAVAECLKPIGFRQAYLRPRRIRLVSGGSASFLFGGAHGTYKPAKLAGRP
jgi:hypothetical protein